MKTLILTSAGFKTPQLQEDLLKILPQKPTDLKLAFITTASKVEENRDFVERDRKNLTDIGFQIEEVDIEGKNQNQLTELLGQKDIIFVEGGNTFYLLKRVKESGFDFVIKKLIAQGKIYVGVSAGTYIACPTVEMATWTERGARDGFGVVDFSALNLVPFLISVHFNREKYRTGLEEKIANTSYPVKIISDDQALLVQDKKVTLLGDQNEILLM